jgi:Surface adhesin CshA repetitive domain
VTIPGQGTYELDSTTGVIVFRALEGFTGNATPLAYRVTSVDGDESVGFFAPTVLADSVLAPVVPADPSVFADLSAANMARTGARWIGELVTGGILLLMAGYALQLGARRRRGDTVG